MNPQIPYLLGLATQYLQETRLVEAEEVLKRLMRLGAKNSDVYRLMAVTLALKKDYPEALKMIETSIMHSPKQGILYSIKGNIQKELKDFSSAMISFERAIKLEPAYPEAYNNLGNLLQDLHQYEDSLKCYERAIALQATYSEAYANKGNALKRLGRLDQAINCYRKALELGAPQTNFLHDLLRNKGQICDWEGIEKLAQDVAITGLNGSAKVHPGPFLAMYDNPILLKKLTESYMLLEHPARGDLGEVQVNPQKNKIRLGYFSPDFCNHPLTHLIAGMLECHDRSQFELFAFSMRRHKDEMQERVQKSFDQFIDVSEIGDREVANLARDLKIDIAIDLCGLTDGGRPDIFAFRVAPAQINYLGYLGTMGAPYIDYQIADSVIIPPESAENYSEKIIYLPSYQANDSKKVKSGRIFTRAEFGISEGQFVFCCFNSAYKITATVLDSWARILEQVKDSVLLLYAENEWAEDNLKKEMLSRGLNSKQFIFVSRASYSDYLARYRVADLFLDTFNYNAGGTASDALWSGVPVLTVTGKTFSSRIGASLLTALNLFELITHSVEEYEAMAISLATDSTKLSTITNKLNENCISSPLFKTQLFTKNLERAYFQVHEKLINGVPPEHIYINS